MHESNAKKTRQSAETPKQLCVSHQIGRAVSMSDSILPRFAKISILETRGSSIDIFAKRATHSLGESICTFETGKTRSLNLALKKNKFTVQRRDTLRLTPTLIIASVALRSLFFCILSLYTRVCCVVVYIHYFNNRSFSTRLSAIVYILTSKCIACTFTRLRSLLA